MREKLERLDPLHASLADTSHGFAALEHLAKTPLLAGNRAELLIDGEATFTSLLAGMETATRYVLVQFYIVRDDGIGGDLKRVLEAKATSGVAVYFLYDEMGSYRLGNGYVRVQLNFRNHRKVAVADGHTGRA